MIIPPVVNKQLNLEPYNRLRKMTYENIKISDKIVIIGYRLPDTDYASEALFRYASREGNNNKKLEIINHSALDLKNKLQNVFNSNEVLCYYDLEKYFKNEILN